MRRVLCTVVLALVAFPGAAAAAGISISVDQPGVYGRIDIGTLPPPPVIYPQPVIIQQGPVVVAPQPIYLRVPPGHAKHWNKHCHRYQACGLPVYFVQERWYQKVYVPHTHGDGDRQGRDHPHQRGDGEGHRKEHKHGRDHSHGWDDGDGHERGYKHGHAQD